MGGEFANQVEGDDDGRQGRKKAVRGLNLR